MNIFYLDDNMETSAKYHCDAHSGKMILESTQILSTVLRKYNGHDIKFLNKHTNKHQTFRMLDGETFSYNNETKSWEFDNKIAYSSSHANHPDTLWAGKSLDNWLWLREFVRVLNVENRSRRNNTADHKSAIVAEQLAIPNIKVMGWTEPPCCMPTEFVTDSVVESYRNYYRGAKRHLAKWTNRPIPDWWY